MSAQSIPEGHHHYLLAHKAGMIDKMHVTKDGQTLHEFDPFTTEAQLRNYCEGQGPGRYVVYGYDARGKKMTNPRALVVQDPASRPEKVVSLSPGSAFRSSRPITDRGQPIEDVATASTLKWMQDREERMRLDEESRRAEQRLEEERRAAEFDRMMDERNRLAKEIEEKRLDAERLFSDQRSKDEERRREEANSMQALMMGFLERQAVADAERRDREAKEEATRREREEQRRADEDRQRREWIELTRQREREWLAQMQQREEEIAARREVEHHRAIERQKSEFEQRLQLEREAAVSRIQQAEEWQRAQEMMRQERSEREAEYQARLLKMERERMKREFTSKTALENNPTQMPPEVLTEYWLRRLDREYPEESPFEKVMEKYVAPALSMFTGNAAMPNVQGADAPDRHPALTGQPSNGAPIPRTIDEQDGLPEVFDDDDFYDDDAFDDGDFQ